ncbi:molybdate ABC transporter substrate-binding protein [Crateriforma conspicua]|uniref:Putative binding protein n=1 Tax=Crateriforma conspicua TaxID=2527996 RepID=A0A5C5YCI2_9PLAN|nr:molybdate ABC transporter substrate-binding protein [Crateriforma conspicua]TWT71032.1 putative binding protein precursor [Crateriforma conspicua]
MNRPLLWMLGSIVVLGLLITTMAGVNFSSQTTSTDGQPPIVLYCAASNRAVMEAIRERYEDEYAREIQIQYGPSQTLLSSVDVSGAGDLFLPADDSYLKLAQQKGLIREILPIADMQVVVAVRRQDAENIQSLDDILSDSVKLVQASPETAAVGKLVQQTLQQSGQWDDVSAATVAYRATVTEVASDIVVGAADAGFVYDAVLHTYPDLVAVELPELKPAVSRVAVGVIDQSKQPTAALHFARYVSAKDRGLIQYDQQGFQTAGHDVWADVPELSVFAGSMLRPAIEDTIAAFEEREGVTVNRVYNGCGILVAQMQAGQHPDAYFACDQEFMNQVHDLFPQPVQVSQNELVILVQKGNPHNIASLKDLAREGLRVGIGHEKQCAMGWITQNTFREGGVQEEIMPNVTVQTPTGDMLVNQLQTGSLDAAVAYLSNAAGAGEFLDAIQITGIECSTAVQPWAVNKESSHPETASRLFQKICSTESQEIFAAEGFRWRLESDEIR